MRARAFRRHPGTTATLLTALPALVVLSGACADPEGTTTWSATASHGPVRGPVTPMSENDAWLAYEGDEPAFFCGPGDDEDFLFHGSVRADGTRDGDQEERIERLAGTGANALYVMAVRSHGGDGDETQNPFREHDPALGLDPDVLDQWNRWFRQLEESGVVVYFFFYDDSATIWETGDEVGAEERRFLETIVDRFSERENLVWVVAEEYQEAFSRERAASIARVIRRADDRDRAIAIHQLHGLEFDFPEDPHIDQFAIQFNVPTAEELHAGVVEAFEEADGRYSLAMVEAEGHGTGAVARRKNWAVALAGAYSLVYSWEASSAAIGDLEDCGRLVRFMESIPLGGMRPSDGLARSDTRYVLADPGRAYVLYAAEADSALGVSGLPPGSYDLRWFDPASGRSTTEQTGDLAAGDRSWPLPEGWSGEVALYVERRGG